MVEFLVGIDRIAERVRTTVVGERLAAPHALDLLGRMALPRPPLGPWGRGTWYRECPYQAPPRSFGL